MRFGQNLDLRLNLAVPLTLFTATNTIVKATKVKRFKKILVAIDTRNNQHPIVDKAAEIAFFNQSTLKIVDVVPEIPWIARMAVKESEHMLDLLTAEKQNVLDRLADPLIKKGLNVETAILSGKTSVELVREVIRNDHHLLLAVAKGSNSKLHGAYGHTAKRLLRLCPCPVWLVPADSKTKFQHVMGCVDTSSDDPLDAELNEKVYELSESISKYYHGRRSIVHAWSIWNEPMLEDQFSPERFAEQVEAYRIRATNGLEKFLKRQDSSVKADNVHMLKGEPRDVIPNFAL